MVHAGNILGFGELPWAEAPLAWQISDVCYLILDAIAAVGLVLLRPWGVAAFLLAAFSEMLLFTLVPGWFVLRPEHATLLQSFVIYHLVAVCTWYLLWRRERKQRA
ncbi:MAG: hypothetical protein CL799_07030 [Chromatiales bacterium]|mgnify:CR=1 FL=1|nr:hypothetical protein [Chromatiales bacterium]MDP6151374.1 hypothetical protein [Gammaproteobacteria bacterium]MDP7270341.1 hypothetical protein [Gammaproteobacteria bacterium]HJP04500.1 hypothetical protein [Gammaproteobacteria bacterium]